MRASLVDVSRYQGSVDVGRIKSAGFCGVVNRCTIGLSTDGAAIGQGLNYYLANQETSRSLGMIFGAYHVIWPANDNPEGEADWFMANCGDIDLAVLDVELTHGLTKSEVQAQCKKWLDRVSGALDCRVVVYTGSWWWNQAAGWENQYPLWEAEYTVSQPRGGVDIGQQPDSDSPHFIGWNDWKLWQWTSGGKPLGAQSASLDYNVYNGDEDDLREWLALEVQEPPDEEPIPIELRVPAGAVAVSVVEV